jgi:hypothetical protein
LSFFKELKRRNVFRVAIGTEDMLKTFSNVLGSKVRNLPMRLFFKATSYLGIQHYLLSQQ